MMRIGCYKMHGRHQRLTALRKEEEKVQLAFLAFIIKIHDVVTSRTHIIYRLLGIFMKSYSFLKIRQKSGYPNEKTVKKIFQKCNFLQREIIHAVCLSLLRNHVVYSVLNNKSTADITKCPSCPYSRLPHITSYHGWLVRIVNLWQLTPLLAR